MASLRPPPPPQKIMPMMDLEITVVSAKHLKNVNWRNGDLKPYAVAYVDHDCRSATKPDESTKPVWNERLLLPLPSFLNNGLDGGGGGNDIVFTLDVFHSKPSETPKPLVGTARLPLRDLLIDFSCPSSAGPAQIRTLDLRRPSGRPHGKVRIKIALRERPTPPPPSPPSPPQEQQNYHMVPPPSHYHSAAPPPPMLLPRDYRAFYQSPLPPPLQYPYPGSYADPYSSAGGYGYYSAPPPAARPPMYYDRTPTYYGGPSAPVYYPSSYEQKAKGGLMGMGSVLAIGAVAGALGGLTLQEGIKHEEDRIAERVETDLAARDDYRDYRDDY